MLRRHQNTMSRLDSGLASLLSDHPVDLCADKTRARTDHVIRHASSAIHRMQVKNIRTYSIHAQQSGRLSSLFCSLLREHTSRDFCRDWRSDKRLWLHVHCGFLSCQTTVTPAWWRSTVTLEFLSCCILSDLSTMQIVNQANVQASRDGFLSIRASKLGIRHPPSLRGNRWRSSR